MSHGRPPRVARAHHALPTVQHYPSPPSSASQNDAGNGLSQLSICTARHRANEALKLPRLHTARSSGNPPYRGKFTRKSAQIDKSAPESINTSAILNLIV